MFSQTQCSKNLANCPHLSSSTPVPQFCPSGLSGLLEAQYQQASLTLQDLHLKTQQSPAMISSLSFFKRIKTKLKVSHTNRTLFSTCSGFLKDKRSSYLYVESGVKIWSLLKQDILESWPSP